jgi:hypothetical protein
MGSATASSEATAASATVSMIVSRLAPAGELRASRIGCATNLIREGAQFGLGEPVLHGERNDFAYFAIAGPPSGSVICESPRPIERDSRNQLEILVATREIELCQL